eukprot:Gb_19291 [translate_table: standard]
MQQLRMTKENNLFEFIPSTKNNQTFLFSSCKGLLRLDRHFAFAVALIGAGTVGVILTIKYGSTTSLLASPWLGISTSAQYRNCDQCSLREELTIPGLRNVGNNCFLNVVLQALASSRLFRSFIDNCVPVSDTLMEESAELMPLAVAVSALLEELSMLDSKRGAASPRRVMLALEAYATNFDLGRQQDAAEALAHLLSALKEELLVYMKHYMPHFGSLAGVSALFDGRFSNKKERGEQISLKSWNQYLHGPLNGTLASVLTCQNCSFQFSTQFEFFHDLPISPLLHSDGDIIEGCTVQDCLKQFTAPEQIANFRCSHCSHLSAIQALCCKVGASEAKIQKIKDCNNDDKCSCEALASELGIPWPAAYKNACKQLRIGRCPEVLCVNLHRAAINGVGEFIKLRGHVSFPLVLDLFPYTVAAQDLKRGTSTPNIQMDLDQRHSMLSHMKNFTVQYGANKLPPWRFNFVNEYSSYAASIAGNSSERNFCNTSAEPLLQAQEYNDGTHSWAETIGCKKKDSQSHLQLDAEQCRTQDDCLWDRNAISKDIALGCENISPSTSQIAGTETSNGRISVIQPIANQNLDGHIKDVDKGGCVRNPRSLPYELLSVVQHHGNSGSGHYTIYRKVKVRKQLAEEPASCMASNPGYLQLEEKINSEENACYGTNLKNAAKNDFDVLWFRISDSDVERVTENSVLGADASVLFYERLEVTGKI